MIKTIEWHTIHPRFLSSRVLDLGANYGRFTRAITERFDCYCVAVEPAPGPFNAIAENPKVKKLRLAVAAKTGPIALHVASSSNASSLIRKSRSHVSTVTVEGTTLEALFKVLGWEKIDLLKADIEGAEIALFDSASDELLGRINQITVEFHDFCGITPASEVKRVLKRLRRLGLLY